MPANLTRPCIRGCRGQCPGERNPVSGQCSECGDAAVREHLPLSALASALGEQTSRNKKGEEQHKSPPSESPDRRQANRERRRRAAPGQPFHSPNNSRSTRFFSSAGAPWVLHRARDRKSTRLNSSHSQIS